MSKDDNDNSDTKKFLVKSNDEIDENIDNSLHMSEDEIRDKMEEISDMKSRDVAKWILLLEKKSEIMNKIILELFQSLSET